MLERTMWIACVYQQMGIGFYHGDMAKLTDDMGELKPTVMASVPRLLNRFNDLIRRRLDQLEGASKSMAE